ncbi:hypothetical protein [Desulfatirhabdium butyrativorans]|uniref:hypothetical protein n=1 Tax=Desulfatirhabdium butyrativorans TaxID=340467 RepID=UPI0004201861|nr:hypothetical protein [Desulfatirhabdium butyrativorans]
MKRYGKIEILGSPLLAAILCMGIFSAHAAMAASLTYQLKGAQDFPSSPSNAYFMMGIPLFILPSSDTFLVLKDNFGGSYNPALWRLFRLNSSTNTYQEITGQGQDFIGFGKGWWIIASKATSFTLTGATTTSDLSVQVVPGWNMIANPYADKTLSWPQIVANNANQTLSLSADLYQFQSIGEYVKVTTLNIGAAYWCYVGSAQAGNLTITYPTTALTAESMKSQFLTTASTTPPPPLPPGASLKISSPKEGDSIRYGEGLAISWNSSGISPEGFSNTVSISISPDNGQHFISIASELENTGFFQIQIPLRLRSTHFVVKVSSDLYPGIVAYSSPILIAK